jgi:hypothetical protein
MTTTKPALTTATVTTSPTTPAKPKVLSPHSSLTEGWQDTDIGNVGLAGGASYNNGTYAISGSGGNAVYTSNDSLHYVYQSLNGDGQILAHLAAVQYTNQYAEAGLMLRETLDPSSNFVSLAGLANGETCVDGRTATGEAGNTNQTCVYNAAIPQWLKLVRSGNTFTAFTSLDGSAWTLVNSLNIGMQSRVYAGLEVSSYNSGELNTSTFDNMVVGGVPANLTVGGGAGQSANLNTIFNTALQVKVTDANGNPVSGVSVTFTAPTGNIVAAAATNKGKGDSKGSKSAAKPSVSKSSSPTQGVGKGVVQAQDNSNGVASGTFADSGTNVTTATTDANGIATAAAFSANGIAGNYVVIASVNGLASTASFNLLQ